MKIKSNFECGRAVDAFGVRAGESLFQREKYNGERNEDDMQNFILSRLQASVLRVDDKVWEQDRGSSTWLLVLCRAEDDGCLGPDTRLKLAAILVIVKMNVWSQDSFIQHVVVCFLFRPPETHHYVHKSSPLDILTQFNPFHILTTHLSLIC